MQRLVGLLVVLLTLNYIGSSSSFTVGDDLVTQYSPTIRQRLMKLWQFLVSEPEDLLTETAHKYLPVQAESEICRNHSQYLFDSLLRGDIWALRMVDAASKPKAGILDGHLSDFGNYRQCLSVEEPGQLFTSQYCLVQAMRMLPSPIEEYLTPKVPIPFPLDEVIFSVCVPSTCSELDVMSHVDRSLAEINASTSSLAYCSTRDLLPFTLKDYLALSLYIFIVLLVFVGTVHDIRGHSNPVLSAFSIRGNFKSLMDIRKSEVEISCLNGLRVIFILPVLINHRLNLSILLPQYSAVYINEIIGSFIIHLDQILKNAVDGFFLISGVVLTFNFLRKNMNEYKFNIWKFYIERYFRLTPLLAVIILFYATLLEHLNEGPLWSKAINTMSQPCIEMWWAGLLHLSNYCGSECVLQSWYVACDFQLHLLSPLFLLPLLKRPRSALIALGSTILFSTVHLTAESYIRKIGTGALFGRLIGGRILENKIPYGYTGAHSRIPPFAIGICLGYLMYLVKEKRIELKLSKTMLVFGWTVSVASLLSVIVVVVLITNPYHQFSSWLDPLYIGTSKIFFSISLGWLIYACYFGHGGFINKFLSWPGFRPLGKLTYSVFLCHYIPVIANIISIQDPIVLSSADFFYKIGGDFFLGFTLGLITYLTVEVPCSRLVKNLLYDRKG